MGYSIILEVPLEPVGHGKKTHDRFILTLPRDLIDEFPEATVSLELQVFLCSMEPTGEGGVFRSASSRARSPLTSAIPRRIERSSAAPVSALLDMLRSGLSFRV